VLVVLVANVRDPREPAGERVADLVVTKGSFWKIRTAD
jgi:hypothetical protein